MKKYINLSKSKQYPLPLFDELQAKEYFSVEKGWTYSYVYHFSELKNIFIALKKIPYNGLNDFTKRVVASKLPFVKTPWDSRRILEHLNGLINFELITKNYKIEDDYFKEENYINEITEGDILIFKNIYHKYFRFKEIHSWLLNPIQQNHISFLNEVTQETLSKRSRPLFSFYKDNRFNDAFIYSLEDNTNVFRLNSDNKKSDGGIMRFWDVYLKWGQELNLIEKFNMKNFDYELSNSFKSLSCVYYINDVKPNINLREFIIKEFKSKHIHIPNLILKIALQYRYKINDIKNLIVKQALVEENKISFQRTSEIFIRNSELEFIPKFKGSYISHLLLQ